MERPGSLVAAAVMAWILGGAGLLCNACMGISAVMTGAMSGFSAEMVGLTTAGADQSLKEIDEQIAKLEEEEKPDTSQIEELKGQKVRVEAARAKMLDVYPRLMNKSTWLMAPDAILGLLVAALVLIGGIQAFRGAGSGVTLILAGGAARILLSVGYAVAFMIVLVPVQNEYNDALFAIMEAGSGAGMPPGFAGLQGFQKTWPQLQAIGMAVVTALYCMAMMIVASRPRVREWCRQQESGKGSGPVAPA